MLQAAAGCAEIHLLAQEGLRGDWLENCKLPKVQSVFAPIWEQTSCE
jgi:hypothetical protein